MLCPKHGLSYCVLNMGYHVVSIHGISCCFSYLGCHAVSHTWDIMLGPVPGVSCRFQ
jgi:hypothetical protein